MNITTHNNTPSFDSRDFTINDTDFTITGTRHVDNSHGGFYQVDVKNVKTGETRQMEHSRLAKLIQEG